jgi:hypothetical protein
MIKIEDNIEENNIEIVFVHLGSNKVDHLIANIKLIRNFFPEVSINCVVSDHSPLLGELPSYVNTLVYKASLQTQNLLQNKVQDASFRGGFWRYTFERLIAINLVYTNRANNSNCSLLHVESDVLLLPNFPFSRLKNLSHIHWLPVNSDKDAASLMYFPNARLTGDFVNDLHNYLETTNEVNDMRALRFLRSNFPSKYRLLPTFNSNFPKLENRTGKNTSETTFFDGIFDAAVIGMWLTGIDPRNCYGFTKYFATSKLLESEFFIDPSPYPFKFIDKQGLYLVNNSFCLPVYNLHIHSKSEKLFSQNWDLELKKLVNYSILKKPRTMFSFNIFVGLIQSNFSNSTLCEFIYNSPIFWILRKIKSLITR